MIQVIKDEKSLLAFRSAWDYLYERDRQATPFQQFDYILLSVNMNFVNPEQLFIIAVKNDKTNSWIALFPLYLDSKGILQFINSAHSDFCLPLIDPDFNHYTLYKDLSNFILSDSGIKGLKLANIPHDSCLLSVLKPFFHYTIVHDFNYYSTIPIHPADSDKDEVDAFRFVNSKQRKYLRNLKKKTTDKCTFRIASKSDGHDFPQQEIEELVSHMISSGLRAKDYFSDEMLSFWKSLYNNGILSAAILRSDEEVKSCNFMFHDRKHNEYIKWIMLYRENSYNMAINTMIADHLYHHGGSVINFARGIYDYKLTNFHPDVKTLFCIRISKTSWGHLKNIFATAIHCSKPVIKSLLRR